MQTPSFKSLISAPWPEPEYDGQSDQAYHLTSHPVKPEEKNNDEDNLEHTVILGYN